MRLRAPCSFPLFFASQSRPLIAGPKFAWALTAAASTSTSSSSSSSSSKGPQHDVQTARKWLDSLHADTIPKSIGELSFSRSSGPGGQNVNKVNSKATLKVPLNALLKHVPTALHADIRASRYIAERSDSLIIQADASRKQSDNAESCYARLYQVIIDAAKTALPGETSLEQAKHVKDLQKADNERRLKIKKQHSSKKSSRKNRGDY